jgi:hypothetical protein
MEVGVIIPNAGPKASPQNIVTVARWAQDLSYHSLWVTDHVALSEQVDSRYPYRSHGRWDYPADTLWLDPLLSLLWAAAAARYIHALRERCDFYAESPFLLGQEEPGVAQRLGLPLFLRGDRE